MEVLVCLAEPVDPAVVGPTVEVVAQQRVVAEVALGAVVQVLLRAGRIGSAALAHRVLVCSTSAGTAALLRALCGCAYRG